MDEEEIRVVSLHGAIPANPEPCKEVVDKLKTLLEEAEKGAISGFAIAWVGPANGTHTGWSGVADANALIAAVTRLQFRIIDSDLHYSEVEVGPSSPAS